MHLLEKNTYLSKCSQLGCEKKLNFIIIIVIINPALTYFSTKERLIFLGKINALGLFKK